MMEHLKALEDAAKKEPKNWKRWYDLAEFYFVQRDYSLAKVHVVKMLEAMQSQQALAPSKHIFPMNRYLPLDFILAVEQEMEEKEEKDRAT
nr:hypothetical protein [Candidatus Sigynarchaeota archaeon]